MGCANSKSIDEVSGSDTAPTAAVTEEATSGAVAKSPATVAVSSSGKVAERRFSAETVAAMTFRPSLTA